MRSVSESRSRVRFVAAAAASALWLAVGGTVPRRVEACCMVASYDFVFVTPQNAELPPDATLLIRWTTVFRGRRITRIPAPASPNGPTGLTLVSRGRTIGLRVEPLARDWFRLVPQRTLSPGHWEVRGAPEVLRFRVRNGAPLAPLASPDVLALSRVARAPSRRDEELSSVLYATARLRSAPPTGAIALLAWWSNASAAQPDSTVVLAASENSVAGEEVYVYRPADRCGGGSIGHGMPPASVGATFAWIDTAGRISPRSRSVVPVDR